MDLLREFLVDVKKCGDAGENLLGLLYILIGRNIRKTSGEMIASGLTWREAAQWLTKVRWDPMAVRHFGLDPKTLPPRDRFRFWYLAIAQSRVDSAEAKQAGEKLAEELKKRGYLVGDSS